MAANEMIVKRYEKAVEEIESNQQVISDVILDSIKRLREERVLEQLAESMGMDEEEANKEIARVREPIDTFRESGRNGTDINRTIISKLHLEMYLDICRQLDEIKELIANK